MRGRRRRIQRGATLAIAAVVALSLSASAGASGRRAAPPAPGTASQIAALVRAAPKIATLPADGYPTLTAEGSDSATREFPATAHGCLTISECVFGDVSATRTIVLFGDSHAQMWLSAVVPDAVALGYRVILLYLGGCPDASLTVWNTTQLGPYPPGWYRGCDAFRSRAIRAIVHLRPALVLLSNRTSMVMSASSSYFTNAQWEAGLRTTIVALKHRGTKVAVIGDLDYFNQQMPECLAAYPSSVQKCASPNPNTTSHGHESAEGVEAVKLGAAFINVLPWICTTTCSPVIGTFLPYLNNTHLDATYVTFLSKVMQAALGKVLA